MEHWVWNAKLRYFLSYLILVNGNTLYEKAAVDRMAVDCGIELKKFNVAMLSLYVGAVKTELIKSHFDLMSLII